MKKLSSTNGKKGSVEFEFSKDLIYFIFGQTDQTYLEQLDNQLTLITQALPI